MSCLKFDTLVRSVFFNTHVSRRPLPTGGSVLFSISYSIFVSHFYKIEVRHILFKKISFFDFLKYSANILLDKDFLFKKKKLKNNFFFSKYA